ncbi:glycosyltransferase [Peribacillus saganii]|uniref:glycosyltransferase n=1 Tax=Peribacillus saganii TaxID=2303992 RepID=UPI001313EA69|nr:glycosyltransferase [Peribacillus saganii]
MQKLKVLQIIPSFGVGGAEKLVLDYLTYFDKNEVEIKAISMYGNENTIYDSFIKENKLDVVYLDKKPGLDLSMVMKIGRIIKEFKPNIIHTHLYTVKYTLFPFIINKRARKFHTIHNEPEKDARGIDKFFNKIAFRYLNCTPIALSNELAEKVKGYYDIKNAEVVNNGINLDEFKNIEASKEEIRDKFNLPHDSFVIGHVGRFSQQKNHEFIIDIYKRFFELEKNSYLILVGDGELIAHIKQKVEKFGLKERVKFLGVRKDIPEIVKCIDVFLFPSLHEGFPITLIEAQATGVRCVISNKIDKKAILSEDTVSLGLDYPIENWCTVIKDANKKGYPVDSLNSYDIKIIVKKLERLYRKSKFNAYEIQK